MGDPESKPTTGIIITGPTMPARIVPWRGRRLVRINAETAAWVPSDPTRR